MRIIQQFVQALASIAQKRQEGQYQESFQQICSASNKFLDLNFESVMKLTPQEILEEFKDNPELIKLCVDLLHEMALICEAKQFLQEASRLKATCLVLSQN